MICKAFLHSELNHYNQFIKKLILNNFLTKSLGERGVGRVRDEQQR